MSAPAYAVTVPRGYRVGDWKVQGPLATGAFGSVYEAHAVTGATGRPVRVALKFLATGTRTPRQLQHLRELAEREVELLSRVHAPRLIRMYETLTVDDADHPELDGATVLVLEAAARSLDSLLEEQGPPAEGPALLRQVCEGLVQLHGAGWVHGDLKPANVLLMADGSVRIADFNTAAELHGTHAYGAAFATADYTPPELHWSEVDERGVQVRPSTDVWAFGVLAHLVLTGGFPLPGGTPSLRREAALRYARGADELRLSAQLPDTWREIIEDCLARTHRERSAHGPASLLERIAPLTGGARRTRVRRRFTGLRLPRGRGAGRAAWVVCALAVAAAASGGLYLNRPAAYGYHRCPKGSVCFFSEPDGNGEMCSWEGNDSNWLTGEARCPWAGDHPVKSVFNNNQETRADYDVAYWRGPGYAPTGVERERTTRRAGCTRVNTQGNLRGDYRLTSHHWVRDCA